MSNWRHISAVDLTKMPETVSGKYLTGTLSFYFNPCLMCQHGGEGFMTNTEASHQGVVKVLRLYFRGATYSTVISQLTVWCPPLVFSILFHHTNLNGGAINNTNMRRPGSSPDRAHTMVIYSWVPQYNLCHRVNIGTDTQNNYFFYFKIEIGDFHYFFKYPLFFLETSSSGHQKNRM